MNFSDTVEIQEMSSADLHKEILATDKLIQMFKDQPKTKLLECYIIDAEKKAALMKSALRKRLQAV